jgi:hypothetical protein
VLLAVCAFISATVKSVPCRAQADSNPDQFEMTNGEPFARRENSRVNQDAAEFRGSVMLPFRISYAGVSFEPGTYSISIRSVGRADVVTLTAKGRDAARVEVVATSRSSADSPNSLVLEHKGQRRTLTAISLKKPGITFHLGSARRNSNSAGTEFVPIDAALKTDQQE